MLKRLRNSLMRRRDRFHDVFENCDGIGRGRTSIVTRCILMQRPNRQFAAKVCLRSRYSEHDDGGPEMEAKILKKLSHDNIVRFHAFYSSPPHYYLVLELLTGGNIIKHIAEKNTYKEHDVKCYISQILSGVSYMHSNNILHRDLVPQNIMMSCSNEEDAIVKIVDFGAAVSTSRRRRRRADDDAKREAGPYTAPEVFQLAAYVAASDVWSCGVIMYELLIGSVPVSSHPTMLRQAMLDAGPVNLFSAEWQESGVTFQAKNWLPTLLCRDPKSRISASGALKSRYLSRSGVYGTNLHATHEKLKRRYEHMQVLADDISEGSTSRARHNTM